MWKFFLIFAQNYMYRCRYCVIISTIQCSVIFSSTLQETAVVEVENETAKSLLQITSLTSQLKRLQASVDQQHTAMEKQNTFISQSEAEIGRNNALIERKQTQIDQLNKKISQKMAKMDGVSDTTNRNIRVNTETA